MQTEKILKYYWKIFISHVCEFYPLEKEFIERYEHDLNWHSISKNKVLSWDTDFLAKYEHRLTWQELGWNESIVWDEEKIDKFKKQLNWYYLGRNRKLPVTEDFIIKYAKKILFIIEDNAFITKELIDKYKITIIPKNTFDNQNIKEYSDDDFDEVFNVYTFHHNQKVIYEKVFLPIINERSLEKIFEDKFDYSQRYYFFEPVKNDIHGLTPEFQIKDPRIFNEHREKKEPFAINSLITLVNGSLQEGPNRLYEVPRFTNFSGCTSLLISENVKKVLEQYKLPEHLFHEIDLVPKKIKTDTKFYVLQLAHDTLNKDLIYENNSFYFSLYKYIDEKGAFGVVEEEIKNASDRNAARERIAKLYDRRNALIQPDTYRLNSDFDLYSYSHSDIIINQYLKEALEKNFPGQILFRSAQLLNIKIDQTKYDDKKNRETATEPSSRLLYNESEDYKFFFAKRNRLENFDPPVTILEDKADKFTKKESALNVLFTSTFKENFLNKKIKVRGFKMLAVSNFYTQNEWADRHPETYKSVVIAENGIGDSINLILEKDSDQMLQNRLFVFFHETGDYKAI